MQKLQDTQYLARCTFQQPEIEERMGKTCLFDVMLHELSMINIQSAENAITPISATWYIYFAPPAQSFHVTLSNACFILHRKIIAESNSSVEFSCFVM